MSKIVNEINNEIEKIENIIISRDSNSKDIEIAEHLLKIWKEKKQLKKIDYVAKELQISKSNISKFIKKYNLQNYQVLKYIYYLNTNSYQEHEYNKQKIQLKKNIKNAVQKIKKANRVLLVGTGNSGLVAKGFYTRLILANVNAIFLEGKPDQITMIDRMKEEDLIICVSFSLSHKWSKKLLSKNIDKIIFTGQVLENEKKRIVFSNYDSESFKYRNIDIKTLNYINLQIDRIIKMIKYNK